MTTVSATIIPVMRLTDTASIPKKATAEAAGFDLCASAPATLAPGQYALVSTGLVFQLPEGTEMQIRPRSGLAAKYGVTVLNAPGTVDSDYRGEVKVILINHGTGTFHVNIGDRIAQAVICRTAAFEPVETIKVNETDRGSGGFGSTGVK